MKQTIIASLLILFIFQWTFANEVDTLKIKAKSEAFLLDGIVLKSPGLEERMPVIIFLVGSGGNSSHRTNYKDFNRFFFEQTFLKNGFAIVYFDKRGVGESQGIWYKTSFEQRALDAKNIALAIRKLNFIDTAKVFIIGHSQGGWIAQIALAQYPDIFAGGISMAGATFGVKKQLINDYQSGLICEKGIDENKALKKATRKANRDVCIVSLLGKKGNWKQLKLIKHFEPEPYLKRIHQPFLLLFGENDELVNIKWCRDELNRIFPTNLPFNFEIYEALRETHSFKIADRCFKGEKAGLNYSDSTRQKIFEWMILQKNRN